jgi:hypothetical protein
MKTICMINDCSHVAATLTPFLKQNYEVQQLTRSRGLYAKTLGIYHKIVNSHADLYHTHYALQDAYLTQKLRGLDVLHCHGSDVRWTIKSKLWGSMVKSNLKNATVVLYATPDMEELIKPFREDAIYLPTPIDLEMFQPLSITHEGPKRALYFKKKYETLPLEITKMLKDHNVELDVRLPTTPYELMPVLLNTFQYDIFIDRFAINSYSKTALEAMACGLNVVGGYTENPEKQLRRKSKVNREYVVANHNPKEIAAFLSAIYSVVLEYEF